MLALSTVVLAAFLYAGCSPANEENLADTKHAPPDPSVPVFKTYGERQQYDAKQAAEKRAAAKGGKVASKGQPETKEPPKSQ